MAPMAASILSASVGPATLFAGPCGHWHCMELPASDFGLPSSDPPVQWLLLRDLIIAQVAGPFQSITSHSYLSLKTANLPYYLVQMEDTLSFTVSFA